VIEKLKSAGQSLWLGHFSRQSIRDGILNRAMADWSVSGVAFSPQAVYQGLSDTDVYDSTIFEKLSRGLYGEALVYSEIIEDVQYAADILRPVHNRTKGAEGWVVMPVSPLSTNDDRFFVSEYKHMDRLVNRPNVLFCLPVTPVRLSLIEELVSAGIKTIISNVYSVKQYHATAKAVLSGFERSLEAGAELDLSVFITINIERMESFLRQKNNAQESAELTIAMAREIYHAMRELDNAPEWERVYRAGARPPRIVWSLFRGDGSKEPDSSFCDKLIAPDTVLVLSHDVIARCSTQAVDETFMSLDNSTAEQARTNSSLVDLDGRVEADRLQREYIAWVSREWAILLENFARRSAGVLPARTLD